MPTLDPRWQRVRNTARLAGLAGLAACGLIGVLRTEALFRGYLAAGLFWLGIPLGCLVLLMIYHLTGGGWGLSTRRILEAATRTLPLLLLLLLPLVPGLRQLYPWIDQSAAAENLQQFKQLYLSVPAFLARAGLYFLVWLALVYWLNRWSRAQDASGEPRLAGRMRTLSGPGLVLYGLTITFASVDWVMSLQPGWYSTIFAVVFATGQILSGVAFTIAVAALLGSRRPLADVLRPQYVNDLGNILLAFVMFWTYVAFSQFLLIWCGNLPAETAWYLPRFRGGWGYLAGLLLLGQFFLPFVMLLFRQLKRRAGLLAAVACLVLLMRMLDMFWQVVPAFPPEDLSGHWLDALSALAALVALGGLWMWAFLGQLGKMPLLPLHDPLLLKVAAHGRSEHA